MPKFTDSTPCVGTASCGGGSGRRRCREADRAARSTRSALRRASALRKRMSVMRCVVVVSSAVRVGGSGRPTSTSADSAERSSCAIVLSDWFGCGVGASRWFMQRRGGVQTDDFQGRCTRPGLVVDARFAHVAVDQRLGQQLAEADADRHRHHRSEQIELQQVPVAEGRLAQREVQPEDARLLGRSLHLDRRQRAEERQRQRRHRDLDHEEGGQDRHRSSQRNGQQQPRARPARSARRDAAPGWHRRCARTARRRRTSGRRCGRAGLPRCVRYGSAPGVSGMKRMRL